MNCSECQEELADDLDGTSNDGLAEHLRECPTCQQGQRRLKAIRAMLADWDTQGASPGFETRVLKTLREERTSLAIGTSLSRRVGLALTAFSGAVVGAAAMLLFFLSGSFVKETPPPSADKAPMVAQAPSKQTQAERLFRRPDGSLGTLRVACNPEAERPASLVLVSSARKRQVRN